MEYSERLARAYEEARRALDFTETKSDLYPILRTMVLEVGARLMLYYPTTASQVLENLRDLRKKS